MRTFGLALIASLLCVAFSMVPAISQPQNEVPADARCSVCGMMVAKYPVWVTRLTTPRGELFFDGVKDMMAYYHAPQMYGGQENEQITDIFVRDYYNQQWIDGTTAYFVVGSDVLGPMGHEFIPFQTMDAARSFEVDHHGKNILTFDKISGEMVMSMKKAHMKKKMMHQ